MSEQNHSSSSASNVVIPAPPESSIVRLVHRRPFQVVAVAAAAVIVVALAWWLLARTAGDSSTNGPTATVTRGPLVVSLTEAGEVEAEKRRVISNDLRWPVIIKKVVPEGTLVKAGETIIQFECKELVEAIQQQQITVTKTQNDYTQASENLLLLKEEMDNKVRKADQAIQDAREDQRRYVEGEWPVKQDEAESKIKIAQRDMTLAEARLEFKLKVNKDPELNSPYSDNEIKADKLALDRLELARKKAVSEQKMLIKYDHPREIRNLKTALADAGLEQKRARLESRTQLQIASAKKGAAKATLDMQTTRLNDLLEDHRKLIVKAEEGGLVVYQTSSHPWRSSEVAVEVGAKISPRQQLMIIPDLATLQIQTKVYEAMIDQIQKGMKSPEGIKAYIRLDARPDLKLTGKVSRVAPLPDSQHRWLNPGVKIFNITVSLDRQDEDERLTPGMTAQVELILSRLTNVLSVPVAAVFTERDETYCWRVNNGDNPEKIAVKVGQMNDRRVQIVSGLDEGQKVLLSPPDFGPPKADQAAEAAEPDRTAETKPAPAPTEKAKGGTRRSREGQRQRRKP